MASETGSVGASAAIHSDVVGSLLRPEYLKAARERWEAGAIGPAEFKQIDDRAVDEAVRLQEQAGLDVRTDGEMRRYACFGHLVEARRFLLCPTHGTEAPRLSSADRHCMTNRYARAWRPATREGSLS